MTEHVMPSEDSLRTVLLSNPLGVPSKAVKVIGLEVAGPILGCKIAKRVAILSLNMSYKNRGLQTGFARTWRAHPLYL
jgi:hypothetical protein